MCVFLFYVEGPVFPRFLGSGKPLVPVRDILYDGQIGTGKLGVLEKIMSGYDFIRDSTILHGIF